MLKADYNESERLAHGDWNSAAATINSIESSTPDYLPKRVGDNLLEDSIISDDGANAAVEGGLLVDGTIVIGKVGSGTGGQARIMNDAGVIKYLVGLLGGAGAVDFTIFDLIRSVNLLKFDATTGVAYFSAPVFGGTPTDPGHFTTQQYVDDAIDALRAELTA